MATKMKNGHFKNVQNRFGRNSFVITLFEKYEYDLYAVIYIIYDSI